MARLSFLVLLCAILHQASSQIAPITDIVSRAIQGAVTDLQASRDQSAALPGVAAGVPAAGQAAPSAFGGGQGGPTAPIPPPSSAIAQQSSFGRPDRPEQAQIISDQARIAQSAIVRISAETGIPPDSLAANATISAEFQRQISPRFCSFMRPLCDPNARFRRTDGKCNNFIEPLLGASDTAQRRLLPNAYNDREMTPRTRSAVGGQLPSARLVSNVLHNAGMNFIFHRFLTPMFVHWGQFIDHDVVFTPNQAGFMFDNVPGGGRGTFRSCCEVSEGREECFPIEIPNNDARFFRCMNFVRSLPAPPIDCNIAPRNPVNQRTAFVDGSAVYGNSLEEENFLRNLSSRGLLKVGGRNLLPSNENTDPALEECVKEPGVPFCFKAGDHRATETPILGVIHIAMLREHNRLAQRLGNMNPHWDNERVYQEAKRIVIAEIQHITYNEFLPNVLSEPFLRVFNIRSRRFGFANVYNPRTNPTIFQAFGTAAYRFGHSLVRSSNKQFDNNFRSVMEFRQSDTFNRPLSLFVPRQIGAEYFANWMASETQEEMDRFVTNAVRNELFVDETNEAFDLVSLNIQRGRDHGLPGYNAYRQFCGRQRAIHFGTGFYGLTDHDPEAARLLRRVYRHPDDIDLFAGGLSERRVRGGLVGPTFSCLIAIQFHLLKSGDRFWYENNFPSTGFTLGQVNAIKRVSFGDILCRNLEISEMQRFPFRVPNGRNRRIPCNRSRNMNLRHWRQ